MDKVEVLRNVELFEGATEGLLTKVAAITEEKTDSGWRPPDW